MPITTPISESKSAALSRVLDATGKGYCRYVLGKLPACKLDAFLSKFHQRYAIAATPSQRLTRRQHGKANAMLVVYLPVGQDVAEWLMLVSLGAGFEEEKLLEASSKSRLNWLGYELVRRPNNGRTSWTWRRLKTEMEEHYELLRRSSALRRQDQLKALLLRLSNQPGFHGVREQTSVLFAEALRRGYTCTLPKLFYISKINHGRRVDIKC